MEPLHSFRLVLVGPLYAGNVGAVARLAANFDLRDLRIVAPQCNWKRGEALLYAKGAARKYLDRFQKHTLLEDALKDCKQAVGFTRRTGELRNPSCAIDEIPSLPGKVALVFGREDAGLTREELAQCSRVCSLQTSEEMPSLNLSQAVAVVLSRLYEKRTMQTEKPRDGGEQCSIGELGEVVSHWRQTMIDAGMTSGGNPDRMLTHFQRVLQRAGVSPQEAKMLRAYFSKTQVAMGTRVRKKLMSR